MARKQAAPAQSAGVDAPMLAKLFKCDERTIRKLAGAGIVVRKGRGRYDLGQSVQNYVVHLRDGKSGHRSPESEIDAVAENALLKREQREFVALRRARLAGSLVSIEDIREGWARVVRAVRSGVLSLPGAIRFELPHITAEDAEVIERLCREKLEDASLTDQPPEIRRSGSDDDTD